MRKNKSYTGISLRIVIGITILIFLFEIPSTNPTVGKAVAINSIQTKIPIIFFIILPPPLTSLN